MKLTLTLIIAMCCSAMAQTNKPSFVKGTIDIKKAATTKYTINVNVSDSAVMRGTIDYTPLITGLLDRVTQPASLNYQMDCDVVNPNDPKQVKNVGRLFGVVPIGTDGVYNYSGGSLKVIVNSIGRSQGFESKFSGTAAGRPLLKSESLLSKVKKEALSITRSVGGKTVSVAVKKYDVMKFNNHVVAAGPIQIYPEITVNGSMIYDYDRYVWYFKDVAIQYNTDGAVRVDKVSGNIRWIEQPKKGSQRLGEYQFDIRVNEPLAGESGVFAAATDESAFFQTDDSIASLGGAMKYTDTMNGDTVTTSAVEVSLVGNKISRQQCMNLAKLIILSCVVPINAE